LSALARVGARVVTADGSASRRFSSAVGRGVVVISCRGCDPSRSPNCSMSNAASA
jgi:hypothetical protein